MKDPRSVGERLVHAWAVLTAVAALGLLLSGGIVTSKGVGMAVPDWPTTFGYNMFLFPVSKWVGGIFYEHLHRLIASGVGLMTVLLAVLAWLMGIRRELRILAWWLAAAVVLQGLLGGLRVVWNWNQMGIFHAMLAQSFFSALWVFCAWSGRAFARGWEPAGGGARLRVAATVMAAAVFVQLGLGATMRHEHVGLAVPDFPLAYGRLVPDTSPAAMEEINAQRARQGQVPLQASLIWVHMAHRVLAFLVCAAALWLVVESRQAAGWVRRRAGILAGATALQFALGAWTVLSGKAVTVATSHMALGALLLAASVALAFRLWLRVAETPCREAMVSSLPELARS